MPEKRMLSCANNNSHRQGLRTPFNSSILSEGGTSLCGELESLKPRAFRSTLDLPPWDTPEPKVCRRVSVKMDKKAQDEQSPPARKKRRGGVVIPSTFFNSLGANRDTGSDAAIDQQILADNIVSMPRIVPPREVLSSTGSVIARPRALDSSIARKKQKKRDVASFEESTSEEATLLADDFQPGKWHVLCGRSKHNFDHVGNRRLRLMVANNLQAYVEAPSRRAKSNLISSVVVELRQRCIGGGFVRKRDDERWLEVGPKQAREKVSHAFRDALLKSARNQQAGPSEEFEDQEHTWKEAQNTILSGLHMQSSTTEDYGSSDMMRSAQEAIANGESIRFAPPGEHYPHRPQMQPNLQLQSLFSMNHFHSGTAGTSLLAHSTPGPNNMPNRSGEPSDCNQISESLRGHTFPPPWH